MPFDTTRHHRQSTRYPRFDYATTSAYFVTICTYQRLSLFGEVTESAVIPNDLGVIAQTCWNAIPEHHPSLILDAYVIMPNHLHGIIYIGAIPDSPSTPASSPFDSGGNCDGSSPGNWARHASPLRKSGHVASRGTSPGSLGSIVGSFKSATTKRINAYWETPSSPIWQRNYCDRIIRTDPELDRIRRYIQDNPAQWATDEHNPAQMPPLASIRPFTSP